MSKIRYLIAGKQFDSKMAAQAHVKKLLNSVEDQKLPYILDEEEQEFIKELVTMHYDAEQKIGSGIDQVIIDKHPEIRNNRCFHILRLDGSRTEFSTKNCFNAPTFLSRLKAACRNTVRDQMVEARRKYFSSPDGKKAKEHSLSIHIDHYEPTFDCLVGKFYLQYTVDWETVQFDGVGVDNSSEIRFKNKEIERAFSEYHRKYANLRGVEKSEHLRLYKNGVKKKEIDERVFVYVFEEDWEKEFPL